MIAHRHLGQPLLSLDFRYKQFSLGTLAASRHTCIHIQLLCKNGTKYQTQKAMSELENVYRALSRLSYNINDDTMLLVDPKLAIFEKHSLCLKTASFSDSTVPKIRYQCFELPCNFDAEDCMTKSLPTPEYVNSDKNLIAIRYLFFVLVFLYFPLTIGLIPIPSKETIFQIIQDGNMDVEIREIDKEGNLAQNPDGNEFLLKYIRLFSTTTFNLFQLPLFISNVFPKPISSRLSRFILFFVVFPSCFYIYYLVIVFDNKSNLLQQILLEDMQYKMFPNSPKYCKSGIVHWLLHHDHRCEFFPLTLAFLISYLLCAILILVPKDLESKISYCDDSCYLGLPLPEAIRYRPENMSGLALLYGSLKYRTCLLLEPRFWKFLFQILCNLKENLHNWFPELDENGTLGCFTIAFYPLWLVLVVLSPPLFCSPVGALLCHLVLSIFSFTPGQDHAGYEPLEARRQAFWLKVLLMILCTVPVVVYIKSLLFNVEFIIIIIQYTTIGLIVNNDRYFPEVVLILTLIYYLWSFIHDFHEKFRYLKRLIYEECIKCCHDQPQGRAFHSILVQNDPLEEEVLLIPKKLFNDACDQIMPQRECEFEALAKLVITSLFAGLLFAIFDMFQLPKTSITEAMITALSLALPRLLSLVNGEESRILNELKLRKKIAKLINNFLVQCQNDNDGVSDTV